MCFGIYSDRAGDLCIMHDVRHRICMSNRAVLRPDSSTMESRGEVGTAYVWSQNCLGYDMVIYFVQQRIDCMAYVLISSETIGWYPTLLNSGMYVYIYILCIYNGYFMSSIFSLKNS